MELTEEVLEGGVRCVHLNGRLDLKGTQAVEKLFTAAVGAKKQSVLVNMSKVDFIASVGIRMFIGNLKALTPAGAKMIFFKPSKMVEDVLKLAGLDAVIPIEHDLAAAMVLLKN